MNKTVKRTYEYMNHGQTVKQEVNYDLHFSPEGKLLKVYNEFHHSVEESSECFIQLQKKYEFQKVAVLA